MSTRSQLSARSAAVPCTAYRKSSTAGSTQAPCRLRSSTIRLRIRSCSRKNSRRRSFPRPSIRRAAGSTPCTRSRRFSLTRRHSRTASSWASSRMRTGRRCRSPRAMPSTRWKHSINTARTRSGGTSPSHRHRGCQAASTARLYRKASASSSAHCGTPTRSTFCTRTLTISTRQSTSSSTTSCLSWTSGSSRA